MSKEKILLVDDSRFVLTFHARILQEAAYECSKAENGFLALEMLMAQPFDLIITDVNMPKMDGYTLVSKVRALDDYKTTPIIMISTESEKGDMNRGMEAGADAYLFKPVEVQELLLQIHMLMARQRKAAG